MDRTGARFSSVRPLWSIASSKALNRRPAGRAADALPVRAQSENRKGDGAQRTEHAARTCRRGSRIRVDAKACTHTRGLGRMSALEANRTDAAQKDIIAGAGD